MHPLARRAALETMGVLQSPDARAWQLDRDGGKMFGVLVVQAPDGTIGFLRGFSGMLHGQWTIDGWVPPVFDRGAYAAFLDAAEARRTAAVHDHETSSRDECTPRSSGTRAESEPARAAHSRALLPLLQSTYRFANAHGEVRDLRTLFAPGQAPGGAGDCAAPKLLAHAFRLHMRPIALAEFWWGAPPASGDRRAGSFYPPCRGKCAPILAHMLGGLPADPHPAFGSTGVAPDEPRIIFEDAHVLVVHKPCGLLSVPGRNPALQDSVMTRLRTRFPQVTGPIVVHRLDLDVSGVLLAAKDLPTFVALQRQFAQRDVTKRYVAVLDGDVRGEHGAIDLQLRVDVQDRPRQIHDPLHGKQAQTTWRVLSRTGGRTRVELTPHTGRTHQLRVHTSHPLGLDAPVVGDRLYGRTAPEEGERLMLHAWRLDFVHPLTGRATTTEIAAPF